MARRKVIIEDNFASIFADMRRLGMTATEVVRKELGTAVGDIIDHTPMRSGMAASGWKKAASALKAKHKAIRPKPVKMMRSECGWYSDRLGGKIIITDITKGNPALLQGGFMVRVRSWFEMVTIDLRGRGERMSTYKETHTDRQIKRGKRKGELIKKAEFLAENRVFHISILEHGTVQRDIKTVVTLSTYYAVQQGRMTKAQANMFAIPLSMVIAERNVINNDNGMMSSTSMRNRLAQFGYAPWGTKFAGYRQKPLKAVKHAVDRMKQRMGPHLGKALKIVLGRPKRYKPTRKTISV